MAKAAKKVPAKAKAPPEKTTTTKLRLIPKPGFREIPVKDLKPWALQYRDFVDEAALAELAQSIKEVGVLQPIITRKGSGAGHEVIAGQRRWMAAKKAGLSTIPCRTYDGISDDAAYELMLKENIDRVDPHPLDEADAFLAYRKRWGGTAEQIAARFGKKVPYVHERLALEHLGEPARKAMLRGLFGLGVAHAIAQVRDPKLQEEATKQLTQHADANRPVTVSVAREEVKRRFMLRIVNAPFDPKDATMPGGSCDACPKRSGNQGALFAEAFGRDNMCTDGACWDRKLQEFWKRASAKAKSEGTTVLSAAEAKELFPYATATSVHSRTWVDLNAESYELGQKSWLTVLGKQREAELEKRPGAIAIVRSPAGTVHRVAQRAEILKVAKAHPRSSDPQILKPKATTKKGKSADAPVAGQLRDRAAQIALERLVAQGVPATKMLLAAARCQFMVMDLIDDEDLPRVAKLLGLDLTTDGENADAADVFAEKLSELNEDGLAVAAFVIPAWGSYGLASDLEKHFGVTLTDDVVDAARKELAAERTAKKAGGKARKAAPSPESDDPEGDDEG